MRHAAAIDRGTGCTLSTSSVRSSAVSNIPTPFAVSCDMDLKAAVRASHGHPLRGPWSHCHMHADPS